MAKKSKEVVAPVVVNNTAVVAKTETPVNLADWGVPQVTARDIQIPKILAMQAMSKSVTSGEAKMGEFRDSLNGVVLGDTTKPIEFVPFYMEKVFVVLKKKAGAFKFHKVVPITPQLEDQEFEVDAEDGAEKWYRTMNFYVLLPSEVEAGTAIPYLLSFRSSSARAGQKLATTMFMKNLKAGKTPASMAMELSGAKTTNDKGTFIVMDVKERRPASDKEVAEAFEWVKTVKAGTVKVDHSDLEGEATTAPAAQAPESSDY
jgi:hypothetical protein